MPRTVDYPHASFKAVFEVASAVDYLGGSCSIESCADRMKKKVSGAFKSTISASIKHGLITSKKDVLSITELFRLHKLGYNEQEKLEFLRKAFLMPGLYTKIYERFRGKELPVSMLDKLLIREFNVEEIYASRVSGYFVDGAKMTNLLDNGKLVDDLSLKITEEVEETTQSEQGATTTNYDLEKLQEDSSFKTIEIPISTNKDLFTVMIIGPGMNTKIEINEEDDLLILNAMINKIKKKLSGGGE